MPAWRLRVVGYSSIYARGAVRLIDSLLYALEVYHLQLQALCPHRALHHPHLRRLSTIPIMMGFAGKSEKGIGPQLDLKRLVKHLTSCEHGRETCEELARARRDGSQAKSKHAALASIAMCTSGLGSDSDELLQEQS